MLVVLKLTFSSIENCTRQGLFIFSRIRLINNQDQPLPWHKSTRIFSPPSIPCLSKYYTELLREALKNQPLSIQHIHSTSHKLLSQFPKKI